MANRMEDSWRRPKGSMPTSPRVSEASTGAGSSSATSEDARLICPNCPGPSVPHRCALAIVRQNASKLKAVGGQCGKGLSSKGQAGKGQGKGKGKFQVAEHLRTELQVFKGEVDADYRARGILLGKGGEHLKHISEQSGLRIILEGDTPTVMRLVVVGPPPHLSALKMMRDLVEFVKEDYEQWVARRPVGQAHHAQQQRAFVSQARQEAEKQTARLLCARKDLQAEVDEKERQAKKVAARLCCEQKVLQAEADEKEKQARKKAARLRCEQEDLQAEADEKERQARRLRLEVRGAVNPLMNDEMRTIAKDVQTGGDPRLFWEALEERRKVVRPESHKDKMGAFRDAAYAADTAMQRLLENKAAEHEALHDASHAADTVKQRLLKDQRDAKHAADSAKQRLQENVAAESLIRKKASQVALMSRHRVQGPPAEGVTIERATASDLALMRKLWNERGGRGEVLAAWSVDNPLRAWKFFERRSELQEALGRAPDELEGFHGSNSQNYLSILQNGFRSDLRSGQAYGSGEYFAKDPNVSVGYCRGGGYMLVCRLSLGVKSSSPANADGDHIWVPSCKYYVISSPAQILPIFIVKFQDFESLRSSELEAALSAQVWSTKKEEQALSLPPPRPCMMSRQDATVLWMGLMYAHNSDEQLESDVRAFLGAHASDYVADMKVQIVRGTFKKAHAVLSKPIPRELVHQLNTFLFNENGVQHRICVEDAAGSPEQKCPKFIAKYCRGQNLRFTHPCWCRHPQRATETARYTLESISLDGAKGNEIATKFMASAPFHDGSPQIVSIKAIENDVLSGLHEEYRRYLAEKHREEPKVRELYHGTNNNICDIVYQHGLQPPSDTRASDSCPVSGGKGLCTTLCNNDCQHCVEKHEWNRCHMYGLGIYLADMTQKSHRYVSQPELVQGRRRYRMIICSVLGRAFKVEGHLRCADSMHDVPTVRALSVDDVDAMIEPCKGSHEADGQMTIQTPAEKCDIMFVQGLGGRVRPGFSVVNSEYIAYHPHQCLPKYEITYEM